MNRSLVVVSDFLEDDGTYRFVLAGSLTNPAPARQLATQLPEEHSFKLEGVPLCLSVLAALTAATLHRTRSNEKTPSKRFGRRISQH
jgi:hypothetical protein